MDVWESAGGGGFLTILGCNNPGHILYFVQKRYTEEVLERDRLA
jgi:hypothetical protein